MGKYFNIIEAMFKTSGLAKDMRLLAWTAAGVVLPFIIALAMRFLFDGIGGLLAIPIELLVAWYCMLMMHNRVMELQGIKKGPAVKYLDWAWLSFRRIFVDAFCWYDKKLFIPVIVAIILAVAGTVYFSDAALNHQPIQSNPGFNGGAIPPTSGGMAGIGVAILGVMFVLLVWMIVFIVHSTRTKFGAWLAL